MTTLQKIQQFFKKIAFYLFAKEFNMGYVIPVSEIPHFPPPHKVYAVNTVRGMLTNNQELWRCLIGTKVEPYLNIAEPFLFETTSVYDEKKNKNLSQIDYHFFRTTITAIRFFEKPSWYKNSNSTDV